MPSILNLICALIFAVGGLSQYVVRDDYFSGNFFDYWSFFNGTDPTHGFVKYVDVETAYNLSLVRDNTGGKQVYIGVDHTTIAPKDEGRKSVRISSIKSYNAGLFVLDLAHMPAGICGGWPAYWLLGPNWPTHGELDIIEGVHQQTVNDITWHTDEGCTLQESGGYTANTLSTNCWVKASGQKPNQGCTTQSTEEGTYGDSFNQNGGGIYAAEWTTAAVSVWFFARNAIPQDLKDNEPDPTTWPEPLSQLRSGENCDISKHFRQHQLVFDITFCGDWAGGVWNTSSCAAKAATCEEFVANNPADFADTFWTINSLKVYSNGSEPVDSTTDAPSDNTTPASAEQKQPPAAPSPSNPFGNAPGARRPAPKGKPAKHSPDNKLLPLSPHGSPSPSTQQPLQNRAENG